MKRNLWPWAIIAYFAVFVTGMAVWVVFAMRHDDQLVRPDYYEHEIRFQEHLDRMARTAALSAPVQIAYDAQEQTLQIALPAGHAGPGSHGTIHLYRPSNAGMDRRLDLAPDGHGRQTIAVAGLQPGLWKVQLSWTMNGSEYYFGQPVVLAAN